MRRVLAVVTALALLVGCASPTAPRVTPHGKWGGNAYLDGGYVGAISANYDAEVWAMCSATLYCISGHTEGWDLVDAYGERMRGSYDNGVVRVRYTYDGSVLTATLSRR